MSTATGKNIMITSFLVRSYWQFNIYITIEDNFKVHTHTCSSFLCESVIFLYSLFLYTNVTTWHQHFFVFLACNSKTDLVFLVDSSGSVGYDNFQTMKYFILNFTATVAIDDNSLRVGVVTFSTSTTNEIWLRDYRSAIDLLHGIISITYSPGWTFMSDGLNFVRSNSFSAQNGARPDAHKVIILMTDGVATDDPLPVAQTLRDENVLVICIGIGSSVDVQQLTAIAYNSTYVFQVQDYDALLGVKDTVQSSSCSVRTNG